MAVPGQVEGVGQYRPGFVVVGVGGGELVLDATELGSDAVLLILEQIEGDGARVVGVEQFLSLRGQDSLLLLEFLAFGLRGGVQGIELLKDQYLD